MTRVGAVALAAGVALSLAGCQQPATDTVVSTGRVLADSLSIQAPALAVPRVSLDAGFAVRQGADATMSGVPVALSFGAAQRVAAVDVRLGDRVAAGDVLVRFDDTALAAQRRVAEADAALARAQVGVIDAGIDATREAEQELRDKRAEVTDGIAAATAARADLVTKRDEARSSADALAEQRRTVETNRRDATAKLAEATAQHAQVQTSLAALPADALPEVRQPLVETEATLAAAIGGLQEGVQTLVAAGTELAAGQAQLKEANAQLAAGIATVDANLALARDGLRTIEEGIATVQDARTSLKRNRWIAIVAADDTTAIEAATVAGDLAVVRAPADGVVTAIAHAGDVLAPGATVAELARPAVVVTTWLAPDQAARVCLDAPAVVGSGAAASLSGHVSRIPPLAGYPPTHHATDEVHLTRAVPVEVTLSAPMPAGVPVDLQLSSCQAKG